MIPTLSKSILVVDDTSENLRLLTQMLSKEGYRVRSAPGGEHALATIKKEPPDLILLDILMPDTDGYEVCRQLQADACLREIPVIFISALNEVFDKVTAFSIGGVDYITKPFQVEEVLARVQTHLSLQSMRQTLYVQNELLHEQNQELEAFAHTVAHDLKNPLFTLVGFLELLREDIKDLDDEVIDRLSKSLNAGYRLDNIIEELLLLSSIRREEVEIAQFNMAVVVERAFSRLGFLIDKYQPQIHIPDVWPQAYGYEPWIEEVVMNYLSNSMKYGGRPPCIDLGATLQADDTVCFWVRDNGPGLASDAQASLFTEFTRLDRIRAQGHGLGLSIVRRIMDKLGGECGVDSVSGQGSTFYFTLPGSS